MEFNLIWKQIDFDSLKITLEKIKSKEEGILNIFDLSK